MAKGGLAGRAKSLDGVNARSVEAGFHAAADAGEVAEFYRMEDFWQLVTLDDKKAVGFAHLAGHLGEVLVRSGTDADLDEG